MASLFEVLGFEDATSRGLENSVNYNGYITYLALFTLKMLDKTLMKLTQVSTQVSAHTFGLLGPTFNPACSSSAT